MPKREDAFRQSYIAVAEAALQVLETVPRVLDKEAKSHDQATLALIKLAAALEESRTNIKAALNDE